MRFLHLSDTHLGYKQYNLDERERDFWDVFEEAIDIAIDRKVDFVIHSGDFFHTSRPSNETLLKAINIVKRLNDHNIPIFCISGNHDRGSNVRDKSPLAILESIGLNLLDEKKYINYEGVGIYGVKYLPKIALKTMDFRTILEKLSALGNEENKILLLHQEFQPYFQDSNLDIINDIPEDFNYIALGHYHISTDPIYRNNSVAVHIGSTEFTAYNPREEMFNKRVAIVELNGKPNVEFINLQKVRPFIYIRIEEENLEKAVLQIEEKIKQNINGKKPVLVLKGKLKNLTINKITEYLNRKLDLEQFLTVRTNFEFIVEEEIDTPVVKDTEKEDFIKNKLKELLGDENLFLNLYEIIEKLKAEEDINLIKEEMKRIDFYKILD
jgi:DNA repair exonuclease SbcCD nuclease subunit